DGEPFAAHLDSHVGLVAQVPVPVGPRPVAGCHQVRTRSSVMARHFDDRLVKAAALPADVIAEQKPPAQKAAKAEPVEPDGQPVDEAGHSAGPSTFAVVHVVPPPLPGATSSASMLGESRPAGKRSEMDPFACASAAKYRLSGGKSDVSFTGK